MQVKTERQDTDVAQERDWTQVELLRLMDVAQHEPGRYLAPAHGPSSRNVVEAGQLLADAVVAASKEIPEHRALTASMVFSKFARHDRPLEIALEVPHRGRTYSTVSARVVQDGSQRCTGLLMLGTESADVVSAAAPPPDVARPRDLPAFDREGMQVGGRELRIVDDAYDLDPQHVGPPEMHVWTRFADAPSAPYLHTALMTQSLTHWTIAASLRPHAGYTEMMAHREISTGISTATVAFHEPVDITHWLLSSTRVVYTGRGMTQSEGRVYDEDGRLLATCSVQGMLRPMNRPVGDAATAL